MTRLNVRLDLEHRRKLEVLIEEKGEPISQVVRCLIDDAYEEVMLERRIGAVERIGSLEVEDVPDPEQLSRELEAAYDRPGI